MASAGPGAAVAKPPQSGDLAGRAPLSNSAVAWLCVLPCAVVATAAIKLLGPALGDLLYPDTHYRWLVGQRIGVRPEPTEQARYLLALGAPILLALATIAAVRRRPRLSPSAVRIGVPVAQAATVALLIASIVAQYRVSYEPLYSREPGKSIGWVYFTPVTLAVAAVLAGLVVAAVQRDDVRTRLVAWLQESRAAHVAAVAVAVAMTAIWMLHAVNSDTSIANAVEGVRYHLGFTLDETFAVLDGRTPLVDFTAQYGSLWPYLAALTMLVFGKTLLVFTIAMCTLTAVALLAIFGVLRRVTRNSLTALLLYLPFLATSLFMVRGTLTSRDTFGTYFAAFPLRYAGPFLLAWLTARHLDRAGRLGVWGLFATATLVLLNNTDYGVAALGATVAALVWTTTAVPSRRSAAQLAASVAAGVATGLALVCLLTLVRTGSLPQFSRLTDYPRMYTLGGYGMLPFVTVLGLHVAIFLTYVAAIGTATVRAVERAPDRVLTGMLAWSGVFGLGSASYFVGRSHPEALVATFSAWALALALLTVVVVRQLLANPRRRPSIAAVTVLFAFGVAACSLAQTPAPWTQLDRISAPFVPRGEVVSEAPLAPSRDSDVTRFVSSLAFGPKRFALKPGAPVAILLTIGHRVADAYGLVNVSPYTGTESLETAERVEEVIAALRKAGGNTMILPTSIDPGIYDVVVRHGFKIVTSSGLGTFRGDGSLPNAVTPPWQDQYLTKWVDTHNLHPRALR